MLQQGQVDAISTDDAVLAGLGRAGPERGGGRPQHRRRALRRRASRRRTATWFVSSTESSSGCVTTEHGSASTRPGCEASVRPPARRRRATRTDHGRADHRRDRSRTRVPRKGSRIDVGDAGGVGQPRRARARASLSADRRDRATVDGDREIARAAVGGPGPDDVDPGVRADVAGAPIKARRRRPRRVDEIAARASARGVSPANPVGAATNQRPR